MIEAVGRGGAAETHNVCIHDGADILTGDTESNC